MKKKDYCPICERSLNYFEWHDHKAVGVTEWLSQCRICNYMKHYYHGDIDIIIGFWRKKIKKEDSEEYLAQIMKLFEKEIKKLKK